MAVRVERGRVQAAHQSLRHFVAKSEWSDDAVLAAVRALVPPCIERRGPSRGLTIDDSDSGMRRKGKHSAEVARQYSGQFSKEGNSMVTPGEVPASRPPDRIVSRAGGPTLQW